MIKVWYYKTNSARKRNEVFGEFNVPIEINIPEIPEVDPKLKGAAKKSAEKKRGELVKQREVLVEEAKLKAKFKALDEVRELIGYNGVLVANIVEEEK